MQFTVKWTRIGRVAVGRAVWDCTSLLSLLKIDRNFFEGGGRRKMGGYAILWAWKEGGGGVGGLMGSGLILTNLCSSTHQIASNAWLPSYNIDLRYVRITQWERKLGGGGGKGVVTVLFNNYQFSLQGVPNRFLLSVLHAVQYSPYMTRKKLTPSCSFLDAAIGSCIGWTRKARQKVILENFRQHTRLVKKWPSHPIIISENYEQG
jgi:hypothetical protein